MFDDLLAWLEDTALDPEAGTDELLDELQELEPQELRDVCDRLWILELVVSYCKARKRDA